MLAQQRQLGTTVDSVHSTSLSGSLRTRRVACIPLAPTDEEASLARETGRHARPSESLRRAYVAARNRIPEGGKHITLQIDQESWPIT